MVRPRMRIGTAVATGPDGGSGPWAVRYHQRAVTARHLPDELRVMGHLATVDPRRGPGRTARDRHEPVRVTEQHGTCRSGRVRNGAQQYLGQHLQGRRRGKGLDEALHVGRIDVSLPDRDRSRLSSQGYVRSNRSLRTTMPMPSQRRWAVRNSARLPSSRPACAYSAPASS